MGEGQDERRGTEKNISYRFVELLKSETKEREWDPSYLTHCYLEALPH